MGHKKGFTLIELLVVIGILAVLLAITLIAVNPAEQLESADNTKRASDVNAILNAVNQYMIDNNGTVPAGIGVSATPIATGVGNIDLCTILVPQYIAAMPQDPASLSGADITSCTSYDSNYAASTANGRVTITAPDATNGTISVTR